MSRSRLSIRFVAAACILVALALILSSSSVAEPPPGRNAASETVVDLGGDRLFGRERRGRLVQREGLELAQAARRRRSACKRLRGRDLAPDRRVKLVRRRNEDGGTDLLGCVLPRGRVHLVASSEDRGTSGSSYRLRRVAGAIVLVDSSESSQYGGGERTFVKSLASGREYKIASRCSALVGGACDPAKNTSALAAFINRRGQAAAALAGAGGQTTSIVGFSPRGTGQVLDTGDQLPFASLRLRGSQVTWSHAGQLRTAQLPD